MAGLIDFSLLGPGVDFQGAANNFVNARNNRNQNELQKVQLARQTRADARDEANYQREETQRAAFAAAINPTTGQADPDKMRAAIVASGDPQKLFQFEKSQADAKTAQIEQGLKRLGAIAQVTRGAKDQPSYERALETARGMGLDVSKFPPQFDPQIIKDARLQALDEKDSLEFELKESKFKLDAADTETDNRRADAQFGETVRSNRTSEAQRGQGLALQARGQNMTDARARQSNAIAAGGVDKLTRKTEGDLRKEFNALPDVKGFREVQTSYRQIKGSARKPNPTAADDISTIFSYMKMLDPGSVVREGEFANAQNSAGVPDQIRNAYNKARDGTRLNADQRKNFVSSAAEIVVARGKRYNEIAKDYGSYASDYGANPDRVASRVKDITGQRQPREAAGGTLSRAKGGVRVWTPGGR